MAKYVMAARRTAKSRASADELVFQALDEFDKEPFPGLRGAGRQSLTPRAVFEADPAEVAARAAEMRDRVIIEPLIMHWPDGTPLSELIGGSKDRIVRIAVRGRTTLADAQVHLVATTSSKSLRLRGRTDQAGIVVFRVPHDCDLRRIIVQPYADHWTMALDNPIDNPVIACPELPSASASCGWWHSAVGAIFDEEAGKGMRIGVVDTGVGPHPHLMHVRDIGSFRQGQVRGPGTGADIGAHGTHVCGIIGARPMSTALWGGLAPAAEVFSARAFDSNDEGANQADIADAIETLWRDHSVALINLSLSADVASEILREAIEEARDFGCVCVCAAGNSGGEVRAPASLSSTIAVGAIGATNIAPPGTLTALMCRADKGRMNATGGFAPNFSCPGPTATTSTGVQCIAPGIGIISTVPDRNGDGTAPYMAMDGTSMAAPAACGVLAARLANDKPYGTLGPTAARSDYTVKMLQSICKDAGLPSNVQGWGVPYAR